MRVPGRFYDSIYKRSTDTPKICCRHSWKHATEALLKHGGDLRKSSSGCHNWTKEEKLYVSDPAGVCRTPTERGSGDAHVYFQEFPRFLARAIVRDAPLSLLSTSAAGGVPTAHRTPPGCGCFVHSVCTVPVRRNGNPYHTQRLAATLPLGGLLFQKRINS